MFDNPIGLIAARRMVTGGIGAVKNYGERIWESMTFRYDGFTTKQIVDDLIHETGIMPRTAYSYVMAFFAYCRAVPDDFSGPGSRLTKQGHRYILIDNPER